MLCAIYFLHALTQVSHTHYKLALCVYERAVEQKSGGTHEDVLIH